MKFSKLLLLIGALVAATEAQASSNTQGYVTEVLGMFNGIVMFNQTGDRSAVPSCASGNPNRWSIDVTSATGQARLSILLTAKALHKPIQVYGTGNCTGWPDTETVDYLVMTN